VHPLVKIETLNKVCENRTRMVRHPLSGIPLTVEQVQANIKPGARREVVIPSNEDSVVALNLVRHFISHFACAQIWQTYISVIR